MNNGKQGEKLFKNLMEQLGHKVEDVSGNPQYWDKDIDFVITSATSGNTRTFEVKWDSMISKTGNLYLELESINSKGGKGWFNFCEADYIAYGDASANVFYIIPLLDLTRIANKVPYREAKCGNESVGQLVALKDIKDYISILGGKN